jgi:hypothetical protein
MSIVAELQKKAFSLSISCTVPKSLDQKNNFQPTAMINESTSTFFFFCLFRI